MAMALFDGDGLRDFVAAGEKSPPPVFVGRTEAIADIEAATRRAWKPGESKQGKPGITRILQGAPGAGKSSILAEMEFRSHRAAAPGSPRVLVLSSEWLTSDLPSALAAVSAAGGMNHDEWSKRAGRIHHRISAVGAFGLSLELARSGAKPPDNLFELARAMPATTWNAPLIAAVDEAQNLPAGETMPTAIFLRSIHNATSGLPLTLVLAGLGDTQDRAQKMGLTRGLKLNEVGRLSVEETDELMRGFCRRFGLRADGSEPYLAELAAGAEGWPRHLHFALQALGEEALAADGDLGRISWSAAAKLAAESRLRYYRAQQSPELKATDRLVAAVMRDLRDDMPWSDVVGLIEANAADAPGFRLPDSTTPEAFFRRLVHQGALHEGADGRFHCPIPSFRSFLIDAGERKPRREPTPPPKPDLPEGSPSLF